MGILGLIVHTWGGVDKSQAVCPQKEALHSHNALEAGEHHVFGAGAWHSIFYSVFCVR